MPTSDAQIAANRLNALQSTGPRTPEGKARSRANALKHGLCSAVVVAEDPALIQERVNDFFDTLKPQNEFHSWLVSKIAVGSLRIDRCERIERRLRDRRSLRAELVWEHDRRLEIEILGGKLGDRPGEVVQELRGTPTGCDWLMSRWALLAHAAENHGPWTEAQAKLASRMMGTPDEFLMTCDPTSSVDMQGRAFGPVEGQAAVARREIDALMERKEIVAEIDEVDRALAESDLLDEWHPDLKRLRRLEGTLHSRFRWYLAQLKYESPNFKPNPDIRSAWSIPEPYKPPEVFAGPSIALEPTATAPVEPEPEPEPETEPDEPERPKPVAEFPAPAGARVDLKLKKAEARREARKRGRDRRLA